MGKNHIWKSFHESHEAATIPIVLITNKNKAASDFPCEAWLESSLRSQVRCHRKLQPIHCIPCLAQNSEGTSPYNPKKNVGISGIIPEWLWKISPQIEHFDLSRNQLSGKLPNSLSFSSSSVCSMVDLSSNRFDCGIPLWYNLAYLFLRNNLLSGPIPLNIGELSSLKVLAVSGNLLNGSIPSSISKLKNLQLLEVIDLSMNKLFGGIPSSICSMPSLFRLVLGDNNLSGQLSASLQKRTGLLYLDLGNNRFSGEIPY